MYMFPPNLTNKQRSEAHAMAEHFGLQHLSRKEGNGRFLTIAKQDALIGTPSSRKKISVSLIKNSQSPIYYNKEIDEVLNNEAIKSAKTRGKRGSQNHVEQQEGKKYELRNRKKN